MTDTSTQPKQKMSIDLRVLRNKIKAEKISIDAAQNRINDMEREIYRIETLNRIEPVKNSYPGQFPQFDPENFSFLVAGNWWIFPRYASYYRHCRLQDRFRVFVYRRNENGGRPAFNVTPYGFIYIDGFKPPQELLDFCSYLFRTYYWTAEHVYDNSTVHLTSNPNKGIPLPTIGELTKLQTPTN